MVSFIVTHIAFGSSSQTHNKSMGVVLIYREEIKHRRRGHIRLPPTHNIEAI